MPQKSKALSGNQLSILSKYVKGKISRSESSKQCGVSESTIARWHMRYEAEGAVGFLPRGENRKYSPELKEAAVRAYLTGCGSLLEICKQYKILGERQLRNWIKVYNGHKDFKKQTGGSRMTKGRETTQKERISIARECIANGRNYGETAIKYNVSYQQARSWTLKYIEGGETALENRRGQHKKDQQPRTELEKAQIEIEQLKHKLKMLEMENHLLKN